MCQISTDEIIFNEAQLSLTFNGSFSYYQGLLPFVANPSHYVLP